MERPLDRPLDEIRTGLKAIDKNYDRLDEAQRARALEFVRHLAQEVVRFCETIEGTPAHPVVLHGKPGGFIGPQPDVLERYRAKRPGNSGK